MIYFHIMLVWITTIDAPFEFVDGGSFTGECIALILARGGSKQVPKKNLAVIGNESLLKRAINTAKLAEVFREIWVSTDNIEIYKEARMGGAEVFARSEETATDTASSLDAILEFYSFFPNISCISLLQCSSPFQSALFLRKAYFMMKKFEYDSIFSAVRSYKLRWKIHSNKSVSPLNFDVKKRPRRQDMEPEYIENGMFYMFRTKLLEHNCIQGGRTGIIEIPFERSVEVDSFDDLEYARHISYKLLPVITLENSMCSLEEEP